jgi:membrane protein DedA with SNARE-associated domain
MKPLNPKTLKSIHPYLAYFRIANMLIRMMISIAAGLLLGRYIDEVLDLKNHIFTILLLLLGFVGAIVIMYYQLLKKNNYKL